MADIRVELHKKNASNGFDRLLVETDIHSVEGLLVNQKIDPLLLPDFITGAMRFMGALDINSNPIYSYENYEWWVDQLMTIPGTGDPVQKGYYFIVTNANGAKIHYNSETCSYQMTTGYDDGASNPAILITLEQGDWLVISGVNHTVGNKYVNFAIINNTYTEATHLKKGVVYKANPTATPANLATDDGMVSGRKLYNSLGGSSGLIATLHHESGVTAGSGNYFTVNAQGHITAKEMRNASEAVSGFIEIATTAEMQVDTNDTLAMTPKKTKQAIDWWGGLRYYAALPPVADVAEGCIVAVLKS